MERLFFMRCAFWVDFFGTRKRKMRLDNRNIHSRGRILETTSKSIVPRKGIVVVNTQVHFDPDCFEDPPL